MRTASPALRAMPRPTQRPTPSEDSRDAGPSLEVLVARAREGDVKAFEAVYRACVGRIHALCLRLTADRGEAENLAQDAFVHAWQKLHTFKGTAAFTTWLHRLTVNLVLTRRRGDQRRREREAARGELRVVSEAPHAASDAAMDLEAAIAALPERARTVLVLHDMEGYKHHEIAEAMNTSVGTCKAQLHRARQKLREALT